MKRWIRKVLKMHSPSLAMTDKCRCNHCVEYAFTRLRNPGHTAITTMKPGSTILHMHDDNGVHRASVILAQVHRGPSGTTADFVDLSRYLADTHLFWPS